MQSTLVSNHTTRSRDLLHVRSQGAHRPFKPICKAQAVSRQSQQPIDNASTRRDAHATRRQLLLSVSTAVVLAQATLPQPGLCEEAGVEILSDTPGFGKHAARKGDLLLLHYVGTIKETGAVFDSTRGGLEYRDGGLGVNRPIILRLGGDPVPGICAGLRKGLEGMTVGGKRSFVVPPELGFASTVLAPYAVVPGGSTLQYEVELIRLSNRGPDELTKGIDRCGQGGAAQQTVNCDQIEPAEFVLKF